MLAATPIISYSHYPFSTVAGGWTGSPYRNPSSSTGERHGAVVVDEDSFADAAAAEAAAAAARGLGEAGRALSRLLGRYDVTAHLSGHLHDLMGPHMYTKYAKQRSGVSPPTFLADLEVRGVCVWVCVCVCGWVGVGGPHMHLCLPDWCHRLLPSVGGCSIGCACADHAPTD